MKKLIFLIAIPLVLCGCGPKTDPASFSGRKNPEPISKIDVNENKSVLEKNDSENSQTEIPILMYHYVRLVDKKNDPLGYNLSIEPDLFEKQLAWLKENNYNTIPIKDIADGGASPKSVILTFDDGYQDFYAEAWPLLKKFGFTASIGIIAQKIDQSGYLTGSEIEELSANRIEVLSHSLTHPDLTKISSSQLQKEISESKRILEEKFDVRLDTFVYPSGKYDNEVLKATAGAGYRIGLTTEFGSADLKGDLLKLSRIRIDNRDGLEGFISKVSDR
jgi:peptidoglycan/xylan/chitin deacetylase (PgdA/CDA1 family)